MADEEFECTPPDLAIAAEVAENNLLPNISKKKYLKSYENLQRWLSKHRAPITEHVFFIILYGII